MTDLKVPASLAILAAALLPACSGAQQPPAAAAAVDSVQENQAIVTLKEMSRYMGSQKQLTMKVHDWVDRIDEEGNVVSFNHDRTVMLQRPNRIRIDVTGELESEVVVYNGSELIFDRPEENIHSIIEAPATIDETVAMLRDKYDVRRPLAELCVSNMAERLIPHIENAEFVGLTTIDGKACSHLVLSFAAGAEIQLWIEDDDTPVPVRLQVIYTNVESAPRYLLEFRSVTPTLEDATAFAYKPAAGSENVPFMAPAGPDAAEKKP